MYPAVQAKVAVRLKSSGIRKSVAFINSVWAKYAPGYPFDYKFMDETYGKMYQSEEKLGTLLWIFTALAVFIGCLGLFALSAFTAYQRKKEIGIRKVLGASAFNIASLLSMSFLKPVIIASLVAFPVAWILMNKWLENFPYRVSISWKLFLLSAISALLIGLVTISFQAIKAAVGNPVKSIRTE